MRLRAPLYYQGQNRGAGRRKSGSSYREGKGCIRVTKATKAEPFLSRGL